MMISCCLIFSCKKFRLNSVEPTAVPRISIPVARMSSKEVVMDLDLLSRRGEEEAWRKSLRMLMVFGSLERIAMSSR
jgi:hypothetical protein